uniref:C-type lectin domain-containing protein n=1 Tax=Plectus sambesii TaxID=2011161 RepID=A0A914W6V6_9BILA
MVAHIKTLLLVLFSIAVPVRITSASALSTWCASKGTQAWYLGQSCYTLTTTSKSYVDNANTACTERVNGGVAMLTTTDIIKSVCTNLLSKSSNALWFIAFVQILQSDHAGKNDDWFWVDSKNNTYGRCPDATWASGEPDDQPPQADGLDHNYENCVVIEKTGIMRDTGCTGSFFPAICQY